MTEIRTIAIPNQTFIDLSLPADGQVIDVIIHDGQLHLVCMGDPNKGFRSMRLTLFSEGEVIYDLPGPHVGSYHNGQCFVHLFEVIEQAQVQQRPIISESLEPEDIRNLATMSVQLSAAKPL